MADVNLSKALQQGQAPFNSLQGSFSAQGSPEIQAILAKMRSGGLSMADALKQLPQGVSEQGKFDQYNAKLQEAIAQAEQERRLGSAFGGAQQAPLTQAEKEAISNRISSEGGFGDVVKKKLSGAELSSYQPDMAGELQKAAAIDPLLGNQLAAEAVQKNPLLTGYFGQDSLQSKALGRQSLLDQNYDTATADLTGLKGRTDEAYKNIQDLQNQYQIDRGRLDPAQRQIDSANSLAELRNQQLNQDRGYLSQDRSNLGSWNTSLVGAMNNLKGLNEAGTAADAMYGYQASDYDALAQAQDAITRQAATQENQLAASLAARGLGAAGSGASTQLFSGLQGNKFEQLRQSQQQIGQQRIQNAMNLAQARSQAAQAGLGEANKTYSNTTGLIGSDVGAINAANTGVSNANQGFANVTDLLKQGTNAINAGNQTYATANQGWGMGLDAQKNALAAQGQNAGLITSLGNLGLDAQKAQQASQIQGAETGYNMGMGLTQAGAGLTAQENQMNLAQTSLDASKEAERKKEMYTYASLVPGLLGDSMKYLASSGKSAGPAAGGANSTLITDK